MVTISLSQMVAKVCEALGRHCMFSGFTPSHNCGML